MYPGVHAARTPDKPAVVEADTGRVVTYRELEDGSIRFGHWLRDRGLGVGDHIAVLAVNDARAYELYWGAIRSGMYITFVNTHLGADEAAYIVDDCGAAVFVASAALVDLATEVANRATGVRERVAIGGTLPGFARYEDVIGRFPAIAADDQPRGTDMLYSSGTTGRPKGITPALTGRQVGDEPGPHVTEMMRRRFGFDSDSVYFAPSPVYHAAPLRYGAGALALGGTVVMAKRFDAEQCLDVIERYGVTHSQWMPTHFVRMLRLPDDVRAHYDVATLRVAIHAAAPCPVDVKRAMLDWWGEVIHEYYSSTESIGITVISPEEWRAKPGSVGRGAPYGTGILHVCGEDGAELPAGEIGLIYFERNDYTFEYHGDPVKTAEAHHPDRPTWRTNGDIGYVDEDGYLFLTDRAKFTIISGGVNFYPQEIENVLTFHPRVDDVAVVGVPDDEMGQRVVAFVAPRENDSAGPELEHELIEYCRASLARFKAPRAVEFVDSLPRTPTGKLVKGALAELYARKEGVS